MKLPYYKMTDDQKLAWGMVVSQIRKRYKNPTRNNLALAMAASLGQGKPMSDEARAWARSLNNSVLVEMETRVKAFIALAEKTFDIQLYRQPGRAVLTPRADPRISAMVVLIETALQQEGLPMPKYDLMNPREIVAYMPGNLEGRQPFTITLSVPK